MRPLLARRVGSQFDRRRSLSGRSGHAPWRDFNWLCRGWPWLC